MINQGVINRVYTSVGKTEDKNLLSLWNEREPKTLKGARFSLLLQLETTVFAWVLLSSGQLRIRHSIRNTLFTSTLKKKKLYLAMAGILRNASLLRRSLFSSEVFIFFPTWVLLNWVSNVVSLLSKLMGNCFE